MKLNHLFNNKALLNKKLPSFMGIIVMVLSLGMISWLSSNVILFGTKAATGNTPKNIQITNISDSSFTISYTTDEKVLGTIAYGKDTKLGGIAIDDRDQILGKPIPHRVHHITIQRLTPSTTYYLSILSGDETFLNNKKHFQVTTAPPPLDKPTDQAPLAGKVALEDGSIPTEAIVIVQTSSSQLISALLKPDGSYLIPLNSLRTIDFSSYIAFSDDTELEIQIISPTLRSELSTLAGQANPVPPIILSKNYDFSIDDELTDFSGDGVASGSGTASSSAELGELPQEEDTTIVSTPQILVPTENQIFRSQQPRFSGKTIPDADVEILINSGEISASVKSNQYGNWSFRPSTPLSPGKHTLTIKSLDIDGNPQSAVQSYTIYAEGSQFIEPSVLTPTVAPTATLAPTATPQPTATPTPTQNLTPTGGGAGGGGNGGLDGGGNGSGTNGTPGAGGNGSGMNGSGNGPTAPPIPASGNEVIYIGIFASVISLIVGGILFSLL